MGLRATEGGVCGWAAQGLYLPKVQFSSGGLCLEKSQSDPQPGPAREDRGPNLLLSPISPAALPGP